MQDNHLTELKFLTGVWKMCRTLLGRVKEQEAEPTGSVGGAANPQQGVLLGEDGVRCVSRSFEVLGPSKC